jgi:hypothetical protein
MRSVSGTIASRIMVLAIIVPRIIMPVCLCLGGCVLSGSTSPDPSAALPPGLGIEEQELKAGPDLDPLAFVPVEGTQEEILSKHQTQRAPSPRSLCDPCETSLGDETLVASTTVTETEEGDQRVFVDVSRDGEPVYSAALGDACVVPPLWGLRAYDDHWVLEAAHVKTRQQGGTVTCDPVGDIIRDGESLNEKYGYQESFGFQLMDSKPFYFFEKRGEWGVSYDGHETPLGYTHVYHYACCSGAATNLRSSRRLVALFAERHGTRYYAEIGVLE